MSKHRQQTGNAQEAKTSIGKGAISTNTTRAGNSPNFSNTTQTGVPVFIGLPSPASAAVGRGRQFWLDIEAAANDAVKKTNWQSIEDAAKGIANRISGI